MIRKVLSIILTVIGIAGAALSVGMLITAIQASEWGRVVLYCVTLAVCVELAVIHIINLQQKKKEE